MLTSFARAASALVIACLLAAPAFAAVEKAGAAQIVFERDIADNTGPFPGIALRQSIDKRDGASELLAGDWWGWWVGSGGPR